MAESKLRLGAAQVAEVFMDRDATIAKDCEYIHRAGEMDLDLLVFPEFHVSASPHWYRFSEDADFDSYYRRLFKSSVSIPSSATETLCEAAKKAGTAVVIGVNERDERSAGSIYNSQLFIDSDGSLLGVRRKLMPTNYERLFHARGSGENVTVFDSSIGTISGMMCGEHMNCLLGFSLLGLGEEIHAASWPAYTWRDRENRENRLGVPSKYHALTGAVPTVVATGVMTEELAEAIGHPEWEPGSGTSSILSHAGEYLAGPKWEGEGIIHADVDLEERLSSKAYMDILGHYNRFDIFSLSLNKNPDNVLSVVNEDPTDRVNRRDKEGESDL